MSGMEVREANLADIFILKKIVGARRSLKSGAKYKHSHRRKLIREIYDDICK